MSRERFYVVRFDFFLSLVYTASYQKYVKKPQETAHISDL